MRVCKAIKVVFKQSYDTDLSKRVFRSLIIAVFEYIGQKVDIIAYSMGSPLARKAVLGGFCADTREVCSLDNQPKAV